MTKTTTTGTNKNDDESRGALVCTKLFKVFSFTIGKGMNCHECDCGKTVEQQTKAAKRYYDLTPAQQSLVHKNTVKRLEEMQKRNRAKRKKPKNNIIR